MNLSMTQIKNQSVTVGSAMGGFLAGHAATRLIKKDNLILSLLMFVGGLFLSMNVKSDALQSLGTGISIYGGLKAVNNLAPGAGGSVKGLEGLGIALPESVQSVIRDWVPSLNAVDDIELAGDDEFYEEETVDLGEDEFEILNGVESLELELAAADIELAGGSGSGSGIGNIQIA